ncbi:hypothetical protein FACS189421_09890 [Bacteroidia bacterium]|nr:hypothetical protein FACS189421_09890 [Bacteroidia bacterium]
METAAKLLRYSEMSISDIAYQVGYDMPSSLSKTFRLFYNISPNEYRNNKNYTIYAKWLPESDEKLRNYHCFEKYLNNPDNTAPENLKTEIYVPIE